MLGKLLIVTLCVIGVTRAANSPVFLWGTSSDLMPAISTISQNDFETFSKSLLEDHMIVVFEEEGLNGRDFSCSNNVEHQCYSYLRNVKPKNYYTNVENPIEALRNAANEREHNAVDDNGKLSNNIKWSAGKVVFVTFDKINVERSDLLEAHDEAMNMISQAIGGKTVFMYMSSNTNELLPKSRQRRDTTEEGGGFYGGNNILLYFSKLLFVNDKSSDSVHIVSLTADNVTKTAFDVTLTTEDTKQMKFNITLVGGYFKMGIITYNGMSFRPMAVEAPITFSYYCGNTTMSGIPNLNNPEDPAATSRLEWSNFQIQAPFDDSEKENFQFDYPWYCMGFETPGILSGLFVVLIFFIIIFSGVCWMMDINTMDRFDDPKGKTININASE